MKFGKTFGALKKDKKKEELESNPINDIFHAFVMERKVREDSEEYSEPKLEDDLQELEDLKRERAERIKKKYAR
jgi:hypothetical protein